MGNPKCVMCNTYISKVELKSSGEPYKTCNRCRGLRRRNYKKKSIIKTDEIDDKKISIDICIKCGVKYIRGDDDYDEVGEPYESCSKCFPRPEKRKIEICLEHTFTTKKNECDVCGTLFFVPDSESD